MPPKRNEKRKAKSAKLNTKRTHFKFYALVFTFTFCALSFTSYAAPCYGTRMPKKKQLSWGLEVYSIMKRDLEEDIGRIKSFQHFLLLSCGITDWFSIDLKGGCGKIKQHPSGGEEISYPTNFAGGYGLRLRVYEKENFKAVFGFQHISVHPKSKHEGNEKNQAVLDDWQISLLASYGFKRLTPYLGARWSRVDYIHRVDGQRKRVMSDLGESIGLIAGIDIGLSDKCWLNFEGQALDGQAFAASINYSF